MNLTGVCRFIAACASVCTGAALADCPPVQKLSPPELVARVRDLDQAAQSAMQAKRFGEAVHAYRGAACLAPDSSRVLYGLGIAQAASEDFAAALLSLKQADKLQPSSPLPLVMQVRVNFSLLDMDAMKANLRDAAARFPGESAVHSGLARFLADKKLFDLALAESLRAKQSPGADISANLELAALENNAGAYDEAIRNVEPIENDTRYIDSVRASAAGIAGLSYENLGQIQEAVTHLENALRLDPVRENSYLALADLLQKSERHADAVKILEDGRRKLPGSTNFLLPLGISLVRTQRYAEGIPFLQECVRRSPDVEQAYLTLADAYRQTGNTNQEIQVLHELAARKPDYPMIHVLIAKALSNGEPDYPNLINELALAEKNDPSDADVFYLRGKAFVQMKRYGEAVAALRRSIDLRPTDSGAYYQLGRAYQALGNIDLAKQQFERVRYLDNPASK